MYFYQKFTIPYVPGESVQWSSFFVFGEKGQGKIEKIEATTNHRLQIEYSYWVGSKKYTGHRFYRSTTRYKQEEITGMDLG